MDPYSIRTVAVPFRPEPPLLRALFDVRSAVNACVADWRLHTEESRFDATRRIYPTLRTRYAHLASSWVITVANETSAVLAAWDRSLRRAQKSDPARFARMRNALPRRRKLKASLHHDLFRLSEDLLRITIRPGVYSVVDLSGIRHPLFHRYHVAANDDFGLTVTDSALLFHFRLVWPLTETDEQAGVDLNFRSAVYATSDGQLGAVDLASIGRVQRAMARKHASIQRRINKDLRHQRAVRRRYRKREHRRVTSLLHRAANQLLAAVGTRAVVFEDLTDATETILRRDRRGPAAHRALSRWTHGEFRRIVGYKARTPTVWVNPAGTSSECPDCGGQTAPRTEEGRKGGTGARRTVCERCGREWNRDAAAAIVVLSRGRRFLRGAAVTPSARDELQEAARWRPRGIPGLPSEPMRGDDAKSERPTSGSVSG